MQVVEELLHKYDDEVSRQKNPRRSLIIGYPARLSERHFISHIPRTRVKREPTRQCKVWCSKKDVNEIKKIRKATRFWCSDYRVSVYLEKSF
ncbi:hypothetical protein TNCV_10431 [Trichonephila clavipes]|nr:hypothetical protein TNCV_10431 [Trichonephila clavipes]